MFGRARLRCVDHEELVEGGVDVEVFEGQCQFAEHGMAQSLDAGAATPSWYSTANDHGSGTECLEQQRKPNCSRDIVAAYRVYDRY